MNLEAVVESLEQICELLMQERVLAIELERKVFDASERTTTEIAGTETKPADISTATSGD